MNAHERKDQENVIEELTCILEDGSLLQIQGKPVELTLSTCVFQHSDFSNSLASIVNMFILFSAFYVVCQSFHLELELEKARCRVKAFKVRLLFQSLTLCTCFLLP